MKWSYCSLYVVIDIYSRSVVGWTLAEGECGTLAKELIEQTCKKQGIERDQLTIHADRGPSMTSKVVAFLYADLGVTKSHSRPYTSSDNPFSESHFRTLKYRPDFPARFGSIEDARAHCRVFFDWYNREHRHSSLGLLTPETVHYGRAEAAVAARSVVLDAAYRAHPSASSIDCPSRRRSRPRSGSTRRPCSRRQRRLLTKLEDAVSQNR